MREVEGQRHVIAGFVRRVTKHHSLISGALIFRFSAIYSAIDVRALFVQSAQYTTRSALKHVFAFGITDALNYITGYLLHVHIRVRLDFTCQNNLTGSDQCFASYFGVRVEGEKIVENGIRNLICNFVWMTFGNRF